MSDRLNLPKEVKSPENLKIPDHICHFLNHYFDKILIITVERAAERQAQVTSQLTGLNFDFFYGVDKQTLDWESLQTQQIYDDKLAREYNRHGKSMVLGHVACALSHRNLYEYIVAQNYQRVMIFEDDAVPLPGNLEQLPNAIAELPANWEMLYLGYAKYETISGKSLQKQRFYKVMSRLRLIKLTPRMVSNLLPRPYSKHLNLAGNHDLLHAYAVTNEACRKLIPAQTPVVFNSDPLITWLILNEQLKAFITLPRFFTQEQYLDPAHRSYIHHL